MTPQRRTMVGAALLFICASFAFFANSLSGDFLLDDYPMLVENLYIRDVRFIPQVFTSGAFHFYKDRTFTQDYYRPLQGLSYMADYALWKYNPFGYHLTNIVIHATSAFLLYLLLYALFGSGAVALIVSLLYCVHPIQTCLVAFIAGRAHLLGEMLLLASLAAFAFSVRNEARKRGYYLLSLSLYCAGLFAWEGVLLVPLLIIVVALGRFEGAAVSRCRRGLAEGSWFFAIGLAYLAIRSFTIPSEKLSLLKVLSARSFSDYLWLIQTYMSQLVMPFGVRPFFFSLSGIFRYAFFVIGFGISCWWLTAAFFRRNLIARMAGAWYLIGLFPAIMLVGSIQSFGKVLSEHYVNIAAIGFFLFVGSRLAGRGQRLSRIRVAAVALLLLGYGVLTIVNNRHYRNEEALYRFLFEVDPDNTLAQINLANLHYKEGRYRAAEELALRVIDGQPAHAWLGYLLLGHSAQQQGDAQAAEQHFTQALQLNPSSHKALSSLGTIYARQGQIKKACEAFTRAIALDPEAVDILHAYAACLIDAGKFDQASRICTRILALNPADPSAFVAMGIIEVKTGHPERGAQMFSKALRLEPRSVEALRNLGAFYGNAGDTDKAIELWRRALLIDPFDEESRRHLRNAEAAKQKQAGAP